MKKKENPPRWQKGSMEIPITLPSSKTKSGKEETVQIGLKWEVFRSRPMRPRDWTQRETNNARDTFASVKNVLDDGEEFKIKHENDLASSLRHAIRAWCWSHLRCKGAEDDDYRFSLAFKEKGPEHLRQLVIRARTELNNHRLELEFASAGRTIEAVQAAVDALLEAASNPPRNRRRFPARLLRFRPFRPPRRPRVRPGSWIDTGRYRPAVVLEMKPDPPHEMKISYGDDVEDFLPHISNWKSVRKRKHLPSLKDVFSPGDWVRDPRNGYGQVLKVRNSVLEIEYRKRGTSTMIPDAALSRFKKVDDPGPEDTRPATERFPPGTWIELDRSGPGVVLEHNGEVVTINAGTIETITVLFSRNVADIRSLAKITYPISCAA